MEFFIATGDYANVKDEDGDGVMDYTPYSDASALFQMLDIQNIDLLHVGNNANGGLNEMITGFGVSVNAAEAQERGAELTLNHLVSMRESISGVSIDEELINLEKSQRAYQSIAKVIR